MPNAFDPQCSYKLNGRTPAVSADIRAGFIRGAMRLESRTSTQTELTFEDCQYAGPFHSSGVHTDLRTPLAPGSAKATDVRVGYVARRGVGYFEIGGGVAWVWNADVPGIVVGAGVGLGRRFRVGIDADWATYRIPLDIVTAEWRDGSVINEIERREEHEWISGRVVRIRFELTP